MVQRGTRLRSSSLTFQDLSVCKAFPGIFSSVLSTKPCFIGRLSLPVIPFAIDVKLQFKSSRLLLSPQYAHSLPSTMHFSVREIKERQKITGTASCYCSQHIFRITQQRRLILFVLGPMRWWFSHQFSRQQIGSNPPRIFSLPLILTPILT